METGHCRIQILQNIEHIGTSPALSLRIMEEASLPDADLTTISSLLMDDPTICAQVLKVANSVAFYTREKVTTISQAVINLGIENIERILFAIEIIGVFKGDFSTKKFKEELFWRRSIAAGFLAIEIGRMKKYSIASETLYISALIANIGVLAVRQFLPAEFESIINLMEINKVDFRTASQDVIGINQREITYLIGTRWNLPDDIVHAIGEGEAIGDENAEQIRTVVDTAEALLTVRHYAFWDAYCQCQETVDVESMKELCNMVFDKVDLLYQKLWQ
jgi:HD-like signal output (HDOD) protein